MFEEVELKEIIQFKNGKKRPKEEGQVPVYGGNGILSFTNESNYANCIIVGRVGAYCGSVYYSQDECWVSDNAIAAIPKKGTDILFVYYLLKDLNLNNHRIGSSQPLLTQGILNGIRYSVPDEETQKRISSVLSAIDNKITTNEAINRNLSEQAKTIYKEMILDSADERWTEGVLSDVAVITMGQSPSGESYNEEGNGEVFYQGRGEFGERFPTRRLFTTEPKRMAEVNDVLMSVRAPVGDLNIAYERCCIGRGLGAIHSKDGHQSYILYTMFALADALDVFNGEGTVFGSINRDALNKMNLSIPPKEVVDKYEEIVSPIDATIRKNYEENCRLIDLRDSLLPKLMSGELDVSDLQL